MEKIIPSLPQNNTPEQQAKRAFDLSVARTSYNYMLSYLEPLSLAASVPKAEKFTPDYEAKVIRVFLPLLDNFKSVIVALLEKEIEDDLPGEAIASIKVVEEAFEKLKKDSLWDKPKDLEKLLAALTTAAKDLERAVKGVERLPKDLEKMVTGLFQVISEFEKEGFTAFLKNTAYDLLDTTRGRTYLEASSFEDYEKLFINLPLPDALNFPKKEWMGDVDIKDITQQDWYFGYMQIAGFNTTNLKGVVTEKGNARHAVELDELLKKMPLQDDVFQKVTGSSFTLKQASDAGLLYACDYDMFDGLTGEELHDLERYPVAPIALFFWNEKPPAGYPAKGAMQPVAIQLGQSFDAEVTPIYTPNDESQANDTDGAKWQLAKIMVQNACTIQHETVAHLGDCHLVIEPIVVAAHRRLSEQHPILTLLKPHFRFTLEINDGAFHSLVVPGGVVASVISTSFPSTGELLINAFNKRQFDEQCPEHVFDLRAVASNRLSNFPFREDTLELWTAIKEYVANYLSLYYQGETNLERDKVLKADTELQDWINELMTPQYGSIKGMNGLVKEGDKYRIESFEYLVQVVSQIIYTASAQHASVNFAQYPLMSYIPAATGTLYKKPPQKSDVLKSADIASWLPPLDVALYQTSFAYLLTGVQYDSLGYYNDDPRESYFADSRVEPIVTRFQMQLKQVELNIYQRNADRPLDYVLQLPSRVPNSISI